MSDKYSPSNPKNSRFTLFFRQEVDNCGGITEMSKKTGFSRPTITFWYNGQRTPDAENLILLSEKLGYSIDYMLTGISADNRTIAEITGLSNKAIDLLRVINETPETDSDDTTIIAHSNTKLINMVLEDAAETIGSHSELPLIETLFSSLYRYISASNAEFSTSLIDSYMATHPPKDVKEYNDYMNLIEASKKLSTIIFGDLSRVVSVKEFARPIIMKDIKNQLDYLSELYDGSENKEGVKK